MEIVFVDLFYKCSSTLYEIREKVLVGTEEKVIEDLIYNSAVFFLTDARMKSVSFQITRGRRAPYKHASISSWIVADITSIFLITSPEIDTNNNRGYAMGCVAPQWPSDASKKVCSAMQIFKVPLERAWRRHLLRDKQMFLDNKDNYLTGENGPCAASSGGGSGHSALLML